MRSALPLALPSDESVADMVGPFELVHPFPPGTSEDPSGALVAGAMVEKARKVASRDRDTTSRSVFISLFQSLIYEIDYSLVDERT